MTALAIMEAACVAVVGRSSPTDLHRRDETIRETGHDGGNNPAARSRTPEAIPQWPGTAHFTFHPSLSREQREDILEWLNERAAIAEFDGGLSRAEAERDAWRLIQADSDVCR